MIPASRSKWPLAAAALAATLVVGCAPRFTWRMPSPDHRLHVEVREREGRSCVRVGSRRDGCFDGVAAFDLAFSPDSRHVAYPVQESGRWRVVRDGGAGAAWDGMASLTFSPDGEHLAYAALDGRRWRMVLDERAGEAWDRILPGSITFDSAGRRLAYGALREGRAHAVLDGVAGPACDGVDALRFSDDGGRFAYVARHGDRAAVVSDGVEHPLRDSISALAFSPSDHHLAYLARDSVSWYVIEDEAALGPYAAARSLTYSPVTDTLACVVRTVEGEAVLFGHRLGPRYPSVAAPAWAREGAGWGYLARRGDSSVVVIDGVVARVEARAVDLVISADGRRYAYIAQRDGRTLVVDERGSHPFDLLIEGSLSFTHDGRAWACLAGEPRRRRLFVVVEGLRERPAFDWTEMARLTRARMHAVPGGLDSEFARDWVAAEAERLRGEAQGGKQP